MPAQSIVSHIPAAQQSSFYTVPQVARVLNYTPKQLRNMLDWGYMASVRIHPTNKRSCLRIPKMEVLRVLKERMRSTVKG